jgi:hypothetical protein
MRIVRRKNALRAKRELLLSLKRGFPAVLCVDGWSHWITVVGAERGKFIYMDSREQPVICIDRWRTLKRRWIYNEVDEDDPTQTETLFDLHLVIPRFRARTKAHFSLKRARYLRRRENHAFAMHWDEYFNDLTHICQPRTPKSERVFPLGELLRRHGTMIKTQIVFWHGDVKREQVARMLRNLQFVADTYALVVRKEDEKRAIVAITANLALWAASKFGVGAVYGSTKKRS